MAVTLWTPFNIDLDADYSLASPTGSNNGTGTSITTGIKKFGAGGVDINQGDNRYVTFAGGSNIPTMKGSITIWFRPGYSGTPTNHQQICGGTGSGYGGGSWYSAILLHHINTGLIRIYWKDSSNSTITISTASWSPTAGVWYYMSMFWDLTLGSGNNYIRLFIDGILKLNPTVSGTPVRSTLVDFSVGSVDSSYEPYIQEFYADELLVYGEPLHTTTGSFTPPSSEYSPPSEDVHRKSQFTRGINHRSKFNAGGLKA